MPVNFWTVSKKLNYRIKIIHLSYFIFGCIMLQNTKLKIAEQQFQKNYHDLNE